MGHPVCIALGAAKAAKVKHRRRVWALGTGIHGAGNEGHPGDITREGISAVHGDSGGVRQVLGVVPGMEVEGAALGTGRCCWGGGMGSHTPARLVPELYKGRAQV